MWISNLLRKVSEIEPEYFKSQEFHTNYIFLTFDFNLLNRILKDIKYKDILNQLKTHNIQISFKDEILNIINNEPYYSDWKKIPEELTEYCDKLKEKLQRFLERGAYLNLKEQKEPK